MAQPTKKLVDAAAPRDSEYFLWDDELRGFGLRVLPSGRRMYVVQYRVSRRTRRMKLGPPAVLTPREARRREVLNLRWAEVDVERGLLRLRDSKTGPKTIPANAPALAILAGLERTSEWVLPTALGTSPVSLSKPWSRIRRRAGLEDLRIHDLRHSFASVGAAAGLGLPLIGKLLGHTQPATTHRYAHLGDDPVRQASAAIGARITAALAARPSAAPQTPTRSSP